MKKTLIALMALAGVAMAAENQPIASGSYTLNMEPKTTNDVSTLYDYMYGVFMEGGTLTFNLKVDYTGGTSSGFQSLLHIGRKGTGFSIYANGTDNLLVTEVHNTDVQYEYDSVMQVGSNDVTITLKGDASTQSATVYVYVGDTEYGRVNTPPANGTLSWSAMNWNTDKVMVGDVEQSYRECDRYTVNGQGPGWETAQVPDQTVLKSGSVTFQAIPEPATATLSLLALCGLCARRRRA